MKKYIGIPVIACVLAAVLGIAFAANRTEEASNAVPASPAVTENTASQLSESTEREPQSGDGPEAELPAPAFTMEEIHTAVFSDVPAGDARGEKVVSVVPAAIPACTAHAIAPAQESSSDTSENLPS